MSEWKKVGPAPSPEAWSIVSGSHLQIVSKGTVERSTSIAHLKNANAAMSKDQKWVWVLGRQGDRALVELRDAESLEVVDTFVPTRRAFYDEDGPTELEDWGDDLMLQTYENPEALVAYSNMGDSAAILLTLQATADGIVDPVGLKLMNTAFPALDQRIFGGAFIADDRFMVLGDVNDLYLYSWPDSKRVATRYIEIETPEWGTWEEYGAFLAEDHTTVGDDIWMAFREDSFGPLQAIVVLDSGLKLKSVLPVPFEGQVGFGGLVDENNELWTLV